MLIFSLLELKKYAEGLPFILGVLVNGMQKDCRSRKVAVLGDGSARWRIISNPELQTTQN